MRIPDSGRYLYPAVRPSSFRAFLLSEGDRSRYTYDSIGGLQLDGAGSFQLNLPFVVDSPTGNARSFGNDAYGQGLWGPTIDEQERIVALGDWTLSILFRRRANPTTTDALVTLGGPTGDAVAAENWLLSAGITSAGTLRMFWEHNSPTTGSNVVFLSTDAVPFNEWTLVTWRKSGTTINATTGLPTEGPSGTCTVDLFINGRLAEGGSVPPTDPRYNAAWAGAENAASGSSAFWQIGGVSSSSAVVESPSADIEGVFLYSEALDDLDIQEDARRYRGLAGNNRAALRVTVQDQNGFEVDLTDFRGVDWVETVDITDELDQPTITASIGLFREQGKESLASLVTTAPANITDPAFPGTFGRFLEIGRVVEVYSARVPLGIEPTGRDWMSVFRGTIDEIQEGGERISLSCRDLAGVLLDTFIETERTYGSILGSPSETELQAILDDNDSSAVSGSYAPVSLSTPASPGWNLLEWTQRREPVLSALRTVAGQIGWEVRYRYDQDPADPGWKLTFYGPERDRRDGDAVLSEDDILEVSNLSRSLLGVRNVVRIVYQSSETTLPVVPTPPAGITAASGWNNLDGEGNRLTAYVELSDTNSISRTGRRLFMESAEAGSGQIDTVGEAYDMAYGCLSDLAEEDLAKSITLPALPELALNDCLTVQPIPQLFTTEQRLAVKRITHTFKADGAVSTVELRGKPAVGGKRWLKLDTRAGGGRPAVITPAEALTGQAVGGLLANVRTFLDRTGYLRGGGNFTTANPSFSGFTNGIANPPDEWSVAAGTWGTNVTLETGTILTGGYAVRLTGPSRQIRSTIVPITGTAPITVRLKWYRAAAGVASIRISIRYYDSNRVPTSSVLVDSAGTLSAWNEIEISPWNGTVGGYFALEVSTLGTYGATDYAIVDFAQALRGAFSVWGSPSATQALAANTWTTITLADESSGQNTGAGPHDWGFWFSGSTATVPVSGVYQVSASTYHFRSASFTSAACRIMVNGNVAYEGSAYAPIIIGISYYARTWATAYLRLEKGDTVTLQARSSSTTDIAAGADLTKTYLRIRENLGD
jgi:hypothetical protein